MYRIIGVLLLGVVVTACGGGGGSNNLLGPRPSGGDTAKDPDNHDSMDDVYVLKTASAYADVLYNCALADDDSEFCSLNTLPILGMEAADPSVDDVLSRVLVSDAWMGARFEEMLREFPPSMLTLFKGLTAIVIDDDIRPAYYWQATGAIYIDPAYLWTSVAEKQTINAKEDYRSGFSDGLAFRAWRRQLYQGDYAYNWGSLSDNNPRSLSDAVLLSASLFLHELAHVNDFLPYDSYDQINRNYRVYQAIDSLSGGKVSDQLSTQSPLSSSLLSDLADVMFRGQSASAAQRQITATEAGYEFEADAAADMYSYSTQYEDLAMLFEVAMMKYYFDIDSEVAFVTPTANAQYCNDYTIGWGATNWIGDSEVKERAMFVTNRLLPDLDLTLFYQNMPNPFYALQGSDWCLQAPSIANDALSKPAFDAPYPVNPKDFERRPIGPVSR